MYRFHAKAKGERNRGTLEQIFNNSKAAAMFGQATQLRQCSTGSQLLGSVFSIEFKPPSEMLAGLTEVKISIKSSIDEYKRVADKELLKMDRVATRQLQIVSFIALLIGNFISLILGKIVFPATTTT